MRRKESECSSTGKAAVIPALFSAASGAGPGASGGPARDLFVTTGKSLVVDSPVVIQRVSVANPALAEALAVTPREVLVNGIAPGETSLIIWQQGGNRLIFDLNVRSSTSALEAVRRELAKELPGQDVTLTFENNTVFLRGTVKDLVSAERAAAIAGTLGKTVNLLACRGPARRLPGAAQGALRQRGPGRLARAGRQLSQHRGLGGTIGSVSTGQFPRPESQHIGAATTTFTLSDALNVFLFRPDLNLAATIKALQNKRLLEILAEPNGPGHRRQDGQFPGGRRIPVPHPPGRRGGWGGHDSVPRVRRTARTSCPTSRRAAPSACR